jgi:hypothetical protein
MHPEFISSSSSRAFITSVSSMPTSPACEHMVHSVDQTVSRRCGTPTHNTQSMMNMSKLESHSRHGWPHVASSRERMHGYSALHMCRDHEPCTAPARSPNSFSITTTRLPWLPARMRFTSVVLLRVRGFQVRLPNCTRLVHLSEHAAHSRDPPAAQESSDNSDWNARVLVALGRLVMLRCCGLQGRWRHVANPTDYQPRAHKNQMRLLCERAAAIQHL